MADPVPFLPVAAGSQPPLDQPSYISTRRRHPDAAPLRIPATLTEASAPRFEPRWYAPQADLSITEGKAALGERIIVTGRVTDENGRAVSNAMVEVWQANAAGRYAHARDAHDAPLDPNFSGRGRIFTDADGRYAFVSIRPGAYPWRNPGPGWRPMHIHFGLHGAGAAQRLITQMYFPGDPLLAFDAIFQGSGDEDARQRLVAALDPAVGRDDWALGYRFDIVLRGRAATPFETA
ncbi:protocatechuate 3,4-dioxygenase subunit beta [Roseomonas sp. PWR1]|uniref:Protocatechuate 3,4-dioxygenase subunit beta n=1 Tax=Roseomonas nitratireducens TaxID=2820810 RepID=A0ABS4AN90_9PROT|nr:protocatechuate 3,4-dioxygenase subunit beta [Neoroseomonas nitratireducens]MBP0462830.1 protocatechuate 3,4-dioxygenase subunit beta [Neoroseomonas nitratireducens]